MKVSQWQYEHWTIIYWTSALSFCNLELWTLLKSSLQEKFFNRLAHLFHQTFVFRLIRHFVCLSLLLSSLFSFLTLSFLISSLPFHSLFSSPLFSHSYSSFSFSRCYCFFLLLLLVRFIFFFNVLSICIFPLLLLFSTFCYFSSISLLCYFGCYCCIYCY